MSAERTDVYNERLFVAFCYDNIFPATMKVMAVTMRVYTVHKELMLKNILS